jgi:hypothetical protein
MGKILDELKCDSCGKKLSKKQPLFETAWSGVYWCGSPGCANEILFEQCNELDPEDDVNHEH